MTTPPCWLDLSVPINSSDFHSLYKGLYKTAIGLCIIVKQKFPEDPQNDPVLVI